MMFAVQILKYHIVPAPVDSVAFVKVLESIPQRLISVPTLSGAGNNLTFALAKKEVVIVAKASAAAVTKANIKAGSSIIHIIDNVLLPINLPPVSKRSIAMTAWECLTQPALCAVVAFMNGK